MTNPLFSPPAKEAPKDYPWVDPTAQALALTVPAGWSIEGGLRIFERGLKYIVLTLEGPGGACVFLGDDRLPFRAVVPGPWHGPLMPPGPYHFVPPLKMLPWHCPAASAPRPFPERNLDPMRNAFETISLDDKGNVQRKRIPAEPDPIQPIWFGAGETAQRLYLSYYTPAAQLVHPVLFPRVGAILPEKIVDDTKQIDELRSSASQAGVYNKRLDAIIVDFISLDRRRKGRVHLTTLGGDQPGETWECNFIKGFWSSPEGFAAAEAAFYKVLTTLSTDPKWIAANNDIKAARATTLKTELDTAQWREGELKKAGEDRAIIDQIKKGAVDSVKSRKNGG